MSNVRKPRQQCFIFLYFHECQLKITFQFQLQFLFSRLMIRITFQFQFQVQIPRNEDWGGSGENGIDLHCQPDGTSQELRQRPDAP